MKNILFLYCWKNVYMYFWSKSQSAFKISSKELKFDLFRIRSTLYYFFLSLGKGVVTQTTQSSSKNQLNSTVSTPATQIYVATTVAGTNLNSTDALWLVSVVKILGYTLGVSLLVILGLVCLFICKRRRENTRGKSMNNLQQSEHELRLYNASCQQNVDRMVGTSRNNISSSAPYQDLSDSSHLRRSDDKGRKKSVGKSTNTYLEPISREYIDIDNPSYVDVTLLDSDRSWNVVETLEKDRGVSPILEQ